ncbi:MAG: Dihydrodipicolinate synthetase [Pedosphaera sp.]|nr:Dihydrodipicolinate synthetase [Pedosphaera sp.]
MKSKLTGLVAAPFTPMLEDGSVNLETIPQQARALAAAGVSGAFICGTTGEGFSLTTDERMRVAEAWLAGLPKSLRVIVHVGHNCMEESRRLAAHAEQTGAHAIATIGPNFFRPASVEQLVSYCAQVAEAAPSLPFYFYHMPAMTGVNFPMIDFLKIASRRIPNLAGIKFTHENLMDYTQCLQFEQGRFDILFGRDEILLGALALGATGAVGSTYNYMAPIYQQLLTAFKLGDLETARRQQLKAIDIIAVMIRHGGLPAAKAMMNLVGIDCGPVRSPLRTLSAEEQDALFQDLETVGFAHSSARLPRSPQPVAR